jgi:IclR family acetate operon transcriptional repressor
VRCIAAPVRNHLAETVAAMSVSGPVHRLGDAQLDLITSRLLEVTEAISAQMGFARAG